MTTPTEGIIFTDEVKVKLIDHMGSDDSIIAAMLVSTRGEESIDAHATEGRIRFLMSNRHGTPFEHNSMTFFVSAPIFVFREFHRHRIGFSYNEVSGRYKELDPKFYVPGAARPLVQVGKQGAYEYVAGSADQFAAVSIDIRAACNSAYEVYKRLLDNGIAKEVARMVLPVNIFSEMYVTCNARSLMAFMSLRTRANNAAYPSKPMHDIEMVAHQMEMFFANLFPMTWEAFDAHGRVAP